MVLEILHKDAYTIWSEIPLLLWLLLLAQTVMENRYIEGKKGTNGKLEKNVGMSQSATQNWEEIKECIND